MNTDPLTLCDGRYTLVDQLGEGGMATVWRAYDHRLRAWRAVKLLSPEFGRRQKLRARFDSEAQTMALVEHPNIVRVYDVGVEAEQPYIIMELCDGGSVLDWLDRNGPMPARMAVEVIVQICNGVEAAHSKGIVHRDVKPHNVLVAADGACKISDFGIARLADPVQVKAALTRTGSVMGTLGYMAPEQRNNAKMVDPRADVYALTATFFTLLTNRTTLELFAAAQDQSLLDGVPATLVPTILRGCAYRREDRFQSSLELRQALQDALPALPPMDLDCPPLAMATGPGPTTPRASAPQRRPGRTGSLSGHMSDSGVSRERDRGKAPGARRLTVPTEDEARQAALPAPSQDEAPESAPTAGPAPMRGASADWNQPGAALAPPPQRAPPHSAHPIAEAAPLFPEEPIVPSGDPSSVTGGQVLLEDVEVEVFQGASLTVALDCRAKRAIGGFQARDFVVTQFGGARNDIYLLTKLLRLRQNMVRLAEAARARHVKPQRTYGIFYGADLGFEATWQEMGQELLPLERSAADCEGCPARLAHRAFGCTTWLTWPIPLVSESWLMARLEPGDRVGGALALKAITTHNFSGKPIAALRARGWFQRKEPMVRSMKRNWLQSVNVTSDQVFHALIYGGHEPNQCFGMLLWLGGVQIDELRPEELTFERVDKALGMGTVQEKVARTRLLLGARSEDPGIREMQSLLHALYLSWVNGVRMVTDI